MMLQILLIVAGIVAIVMGIKALSAQSFHVSSTKTLTGPSATTAGIVTCLFGVAVIGFALVGMPLVLGR